MQLTENLRGPKVVNIISVYASPLSMQFNIIQINRKLEFVMDSPLCRGYCS
jgi:hypothetical protein